MEMNLGSTILDAQNFNSYQQPYKILILFVQVNSSFFASGTES